MLNIVVNIIAEAFMMICFILALLPLFISKEKFFMSIIAFVASIFLFLMFATESLSHEDHGEGPATLGTAVYLALILFLFAGSMCLRFIIWLAKKILKTKEN